MHALRLSVVLILLSVAGYVSAGEVAARVSPEPYRLQPGDVLEVTVWKEQELHGEVIVRPDGAMSFPLVGDVAAGGKTVDEVRSTLVERLKNYIPSPVVTVAVKSIGGNRIYVVGKVVRAGEFLFSSPLDVMQALSLAGGATSFAALNDIVILRRENGQQQAIHFQYADVARGKNLGQNIQLHSGDTVVVP